MHDPDPQRRGYQDGVGYGLQRDDKEQGRRADQPREGVREVTSEESVDKRIAEAKDRIEKTDQDVEALIYSTLGKEGEDLR